MSYLMSCTHHFAFFSVTNANLYVFIKSTNADISYGISHKIKRICAEDNMRLFCSLVGRHRKQSLLCFTIIIWQLLINYLIGLQTALFQKEIMKRVVSLFLALHASYRITICRHRELVLIPLSSRND